MIADLPDTSTSAVAKRIVEVRESGGAISLGRVLTLVVVAERNEPTEGAPAAIDASREHPELEDRGVAGRRERSDLSRPQIRVGGDAGASEVVVLTLHGELAAHPFGGHSVPAAGHSGRHVVAGHRSEHLAADPMGKLGKRRILDAIKDPDAAARCSRAACRATPTVIRHRLDADHPVAGHSGLGCRSAPGHEPITAVEVSGPTNSPAIDLLAGWLRAACGFPRTAASAVSRSVCTGRAGRRCWPSTRTAMPC